MFSRRIKRYVLGKKRHSLKNNIKVPLSCCLLFLTLFVHAQTPQGQNLERVAISKNKIEYRGLTLMLIHASKGNYGYDILKGNILVHHQVKSPEPNHPLSDKETALKAAKWMADQYLRSGHCPPMLPPGLLNSNATTSLFKQSKP